MKVRSLALAAAIATACSGPSQQQPDPALGDAQPIQEAYRTQFQESDNIDSLAAWRSPSGEVWLLATAKSSHRILTFNASDGALITAVGSEGDAPGEFRRPNGVAVIDDMMLVVERDNRRVQALSLPDFNSLGFIGEGNLRRPYGLAVYKDAQSSYQLYVTDNYETPDERIPPAEELGERVHHYAVLPSPEGVAGRLVRKFGDTAGAGLLQKVETIAVDPLSNRLLVAEELTQGMSIKLYDLEGRFTGSIGGGIFRFEPEGIALYPCGSAGIWVATDQDHQNNRFHLFDRRQLAHLGAFAGPRTANTDGVALYPHAFEGFPKGAFFAVHDDGGASAFDWEKIEQAFSLERICGGQTE